MKVKTAKLEGSALDWTVATALGYTLHKDAMLDGQVKMGWWVSGIVVDPNIWVPLNLFDPSTCWGHGGSIIDEHNIDVLREGEEFLSRLGSMRKHPQREIMSWFTSWGPTKLVAAMRCFVASRLGPEVEIPDELAALMEPPAKEPHQQQAHERLRSRA
jgi:hypothetical protein